MEQSIQILIFLVGLLIATTYFYERNVYLHVLIAFGVFWQSINVMVEFEDFIVLPIISTMFALLIALFSVMDNKRRN